MKYTSTRDHEHSVSFEHALFRGLAPDQGLYVPEYFPKVAKNLKQDLEKLSLTDLGLAIMQNFVTDIPTEHLAGIIQRTLTFPIPLVHLHHNLYLLEVFHGPTLAFKDVGARFMANALTYFAAHSNKKITIIVATSGDTGSAIAHAFHQAPNINVYILYPSKKITLLQEKQITTFGDNIHALEVDGTFDDCQRLVKSALTDQRVRDKTILTTSNSINISRLLPQMIYHTWGLAQLKQQGIAATPSLIVPSGNLGNLTSAVYAKRVGFAIKQFVAATNANAILPDFLETHEFHPKPSIATFANAMDVGNPSNFERLMDSYAHDQQRIAQEIIGTPISNDEILAEIKYSYENYNFILDPHTAVGVAAARKYQIHHDNPLIITATAHPAKFPEVIKLAINIDIELPDSLQRILNLPNRSLKISNDYAQLHQLLIS